MICAVCRRTDTARRARNRHQLRAQEVEAEVVECLLGQLSPDRPSCRIGTLDALKLMISGGWVPGGSGRTRNSGGVTCAFAVSRLAPGCRKILTTAIPL